jgi:aspartate/methionine/tyrosine aminotransferase
VRNKMQLPNFELEGYFAKWEFQAKYLLCASDVERFSMQEILDMADEECLALWNNLHLGYTETKGLPLLREEISKMYENVSADDVHCFAGAEEGIFCAMNALIKKGDHAIVVTPCYQSLETLPQSICGDVTTVNLNPQENWELDLSKVEKAVKSNTKMISINFPHNPTGGLLSREKLERLIQLAMRKNLIVFSDEVYRNLELDEQDRLPTVAGLHKNGISLSVMSKAFGLGGLRIGWLTCRNKKLVNQIADFKHYTSLTNSAPSEILALIALRNRNEILDRNRQIIKKNILLLDSFMNRKSEMFSWVRPKSGPICFIKILSGMNSDAFCKQVIEDTGILLLPASVYHYPHNYFRIGFGRKNMHEVLEKFETYLETNNE